MKFVVEHVSKSGGRLGRLSGLRSQPEATHSTPLSLISTIGGSAPHLTQDVLHLLANREAPLCVPAQHFCQHVQVLNDFKKGVAHFAALQGHSVSVVVQDPAKVTPSGYNSKQGIFTWTYTGREILNAQSYMQLVEAMRPDWYEALSDTDTPKDASKKRISKSFALSKVYVNDCLHHHKESQALEGCGVLVPLLGGHSQADRARWSKGLLQWLEGGSVVCGYVLHGLHAGGPEAEQLTPEHVSELIRTSLEPMAEEGGVRQAGGSWNPAVVVSLVELGVDLFDSSLPYLVTQRNGAFTFPHQLHRETEDDTRLKHCDKKLKVCAEEEQHTQERQLEGDKQNLEGEEKIEQEKDGSVEDNMKKSEASSKKKQNMGDDGKRPTTSVYEICLEDKSYVLDEGPLLDGCQCYTCKNFSRAYIHHLINVREMLASVLLMMHNLHHWTCFFGSIREAVRTDCLHDLKALLTSLSKE